MNPYPFGLTFDLCEKYTKKYAKSFYFSSKLLPKEKQLSAYAIYAFCRYADNLIDLADSKSNDYVMSEIFKLRVDLKKIYEGKTAHKNCSFSKTVMKYKIPLEYFCTLLDGVCMDIEIKRYKTIKELDEYCYKVASVVGLIMCEIFGYSNVAAHRYAITLGKAMQITNIIRDIKEDYKLGRIYIPQDIMADFNYKETDIGQHKINKNFIEMIKYLILYAKSLYGVAEYGFKFITNDGSRTTMVMMSKIYSAILYKIEKRNYDVYTSRNYVSNLEKIRIITSYMLNPVEKNRLLKMKEEFILHKN